MTTRRMIDRALLAALALLMAQCGNDGTTTHLTYITRAEWSPTHATSILIAKQEVDVVEGKSSGCGEEVAATSPLPVPGYELFLVDTTGSVRRQITTDAHFSVNVRFKWAPQGDRFLLWDNPRAVMLRVDTAGAATRVDSAAYVSDADWSPDGSSIVSSAIKIAGPFPRLYRITTATGAMFPLYTSLQTGAVSWSSTNLLAFVAFDSAIARLGTIRPDGTGYTVIDTAAAFFNLDWSPDGSTLLYSRKTAGEDDIVFYNTLTSTSRVFLQFLDQTEILSLRYSPDGAAMSYYAYQSSGQFDLYAINIDGTNARAVATISSDGSWSPDSRSIAYVSYNKLYTKPVR